MGKWLIGLTLMVFSSGATYAQSYENTSAKIKTRIGELEFIGGYPTQATIDSAFDQLDVQRATHAYL